MRISISNVLSLTLLLAAWSWLVSSHLQDELSWGPVLAVIGALAALFGKEPLKNAMGWGEEGSSHDRALFDQFTQDLPVQPTIYLLKHHDFGGSFHETEIRPFFRFCHDWAGVDHEFRNRSLEKSRKKVYQSAVDLAQEIARATVPVGDGSLRSVFPDNLRAQGGRPDHVIRDAEILNQKGRAFVPLYESFVRKCRRKLKG